jgi:hypothetical protein
MYVAIFCISAGVTFVVTLGILSAAGLSLGIVSIYLALFVSALFGGLITFGVMSNNFWGD